MGRGKTQNIVECPKCFHHFNRKQDVINKLCSRCNQWRSAMDFRDAAGHLCKVCLGINISRFSTQIRMRTDSGELLKQCTECRLWKPESNFSKDNEAKDKLQRWCKDCNNKYRAEQRAEDAKQGGE